MRRDTDISSAKSNYYAYRLFRLCYVALSEPGNITNCVYSPRRDTIYKKNKSLTSVLYKWRHITTPTPDRINVKYFHVEVLRDNIFDKELLWRTPSGIVIPSYFLQKSDL